MLRALAHALLTPVDERALQDAPRSRALAAGFRAGWQTGAADARAALALLPELRVLDHESAQKHVAAAIDRGASASTVWDALRLWAFEQLARRPGILAVHAVTSVNAFGFAARATQDEATRRLLLLQSAAWLGHYRHDVGVLDDGLELDRLEPHATATGAADLFAAAGAERELAPARALRLGQDAAGREAFVGEARRLLFRKAREHHDWKFAAAAFEEAGRAHPELAPRLLAGRTAYPAPGRATPTAPTPVMPAKSWGG